jgi:hypothetical protein
MTTDSYYRFFRETIRPIERRTRRRHAFVHAAYLTAGLIAGWATATWWL